jgi:hypothetical protein
MIATAKMGWSSFFLLCVFLIFAMGHGVFAWANRDRRPDLSIIDPPPSALERKALAFGDDEFLYRAYVLELQNAGDTGGRATPMRDYNYDYVLGWLRSLQALDARAQHHALLAARYFPTVNEPVAVRKLVEFVAADVEMNPERKWSWLMQAVLMADHRLNDKEYALKLAKQLAGYDYPDMPSWIFMFPGVLLKQLGRNDEARAVMETVRRDKAGLLTPQDLHWMEDFERNLPVTTPSEIK